MEPQQLASVYFARRQREVWAMQTAFPGVELSREAFDGLLYLYAYGPQRTTAVTSAMGFAMTTGLRHLGLLEDAGLIERRPEPGDQRATQVRLTRWAEAALSSYFALVPVAA